MSLVSVARPFLERLADATNETIHLVARNRDEVVYLYKEDNNNSVTCMSSFVGKRNAMYCTGVGKCIMAYLPEEEVRGIWDRTAITAYTPKTIVEYPALLIELEQIRKNGFGLDNEEHEVGIMCIAAPVLDYSASPIGEMCIRDRIWECLRLCGIAM